MFPLRQANNAPRVSGEMVRLAGPSSGPSHWHPPHFTSGCAAQRDKRLAMLLRCLAECLAYLKDGARRGPARPAGVLWNGSGWTRTTLGVSSSSVNPILTPLASCSPCAKIQCGIVSSRHAGVAGPAWSCSPVGDWDAGAGGGVLGEMHVGVSCSSGSWLSGCCCPPTRELRYATRYGLGETEDGAGHNQVCVARLRLCAARLCQSARLVSMPVDQPLHYCRSPGGGGARPAAHRLKRSERERASEREGPLTVCCASPRAPSGGGLVLLGARYA
ncbi:hypothetical protein FOCC_FOCC011169 [Frankliniella occidentalis]|nr:hypothetical protein FOCC_FOCC011169 [Frankliniella occidentalis]